MSHGAGPRQPLVHGKIEVLPFVDMEFHGVGHGLGEGLEPCLRLPQFHELVGDFAENLLHRQHAISAVILEERRHGRTDAYSVEPVASGLVIAVWYPIQQMTMDITGAKFVELPQDRDVGRSPTRHVDIGDTENKRLIAFVASTVQQRCRFGIGSGDDDAGTRSSHPIGSEPC